MHHTNHLNQSPSQLRAVYRESELGLLFVGIVLLDGALVAASLSLTGDRGPFVSLDKALLCGVVAIFMDAEVRRRAWSLMRTGDLLVPLVSLVLLIMVAALRAGGAEAQVWLRSHLVEILRWSIMGAMTTIGFSTGSERTPSYNSRMPLLAISATVMFWIALAWMYINGLDAVRTDLFYIVTAGGEFYQILGDTLGIATVVIVAIQWRALVAGRTAKAWHSIAFMLLVLTESAASVVLLQLFGSNKAPVLVLLCVSIALWLSVPAKRSKRGDRARTWYSLTFLVFLVTLAVTLASVELPPIRLLNFGADGSVLGGSSVQSRNEFLREAWLVHLSDRPMVGNPNLGILSGDYLHSSLLSLQANLGALGTILFVLVLYCGWARVRMHKNLIFIRILTLPVLIVSAVGTFFTWGPLWLLLGAFATIPNRREHRLPENEVPSLTH